MILELASTRAITYTSKQSTESAGRVVFGRVKLDLSSLGLGSGACLVKFLLSFSAQSTSLVLSILNSRPCRIELCASLERGSLGVYGARWGFPGSLAVTKWNCGMEDIVKSAL